MGPGDIASGGGADVYRRLRKHAVKWAVFGLVLSSVIIAAFNYNGISGALARAESYHQARRLTSQLLVALFREESSLRGYTSTNDPEYMHDYAQVESRFQRRFVTLQEYLERLDLPTASAYLRDIKRIHDQWTETVVSPLIEDPSGVLAESRQTTGELLFTALGADFGFLTDSLDRQAQASTSETRKRLLPAIAELTLAAIFFAAVILQMNRRHRVLRERYVTELSDSNRSLLNAQRLARVGSWSRDLIRGQVTWSAELCRIFGVKREQVHERLMREFDHPQDAEAIRPIVEDCERKQQPYSLDHRIVLDDGSVRHVHEQAEVIFDREGKPAQIIGTLLDVTERKHAEEKLAYIAHHDVLTGLPNRLILRERLAHSLSYAQRQSRIVALLYLDLDRFKLINDTLGHNMGDELLKAVASRLSRSIRQNDTASRSGGDEFIIVLADLVDRQNVVMIVDAIIAAISRPFIIEEHELFVTPSIGVSLYPHDGKDVDSLIKYADAALYQAKDRGRNNFQFYTAELQRAAVERLTLGSELRKALERGEFLLHYQPLIALASGTIAGFEALLRWQHPRRGLVLPDEFIGVAEETGFITQLGEWVLRSACAQQKLWCATMDYDGRMTVNISARQFQRSDLAQTVRQILSAADLPARSLELELTETLLMKDVDAAVAMLHELKAMGVGISIDDFGTGYSSLGYLKRFPIDSIKIDRSFVKDLGVDRFDEAISKAIVTLARNLNMRIIGEGAETLSQLLFLRQLGCHEVQGYYLSRPLDAADCSELFKRFSRRGGQAVAF